MKPPAKPISKLPLLALLAPLLLVAGYYLSKSQRWHYTLYRTWPSPGKQYTVKLYRNRLWGLLPAPPGSGSDAPGLAELVDESTGKVLEQTDVGMVQNLSSVRWHGNLCELPLMMPAWKLPTQVGSGPYTNAFLKRWRESSRKDP